MKHIKRITILLFGILILSSVAHAFVMPQVTRCLFIDAYDFQQEGNLYFRADVKPEKITEIQGLLAQAAKRNDDFWGERVGTPTFIYCENDEDYKKFGHPMMTPAVTFLSLNSFVVISQKGVDLDILSHEMSHTELAARVGVMNRNFKIPVWFDEGLAMQVDDRSYYSLDTLASRSNNFQDLPDVMHMDAGAFWGGTNEEVMKNYMTAKYEVHQWLTPEKLTKFIDKLNNDGSFEEAWEQ